MCLVGSLWEWKGFLIRNLGFVLDMATLLMALGHYLYIWWLHGMAFQLMDAVLFLNIRVSCVNSFHNCLYCKYALIIIFSSLFFSDML